MLDKIARAIVVVVLFGTLAGFGLCGAYGTLVGIGTLFDTSAGAEGRGFAPVFIVCGLIGIVIAAACWKPLAAIWRSQK
jgi:hypothetical protein